MPVTALDKRTALVIIDLQKGIAAFPVVPGTGAEVITRSTTLVDAFRKAGQPIVFVNVVPAPSREDHRADAKMPARQFSPDWAEIVPELGAANTDIFITKHTWNAFYDTALDEQLKSLGVTGIVLAGIATSIGVEGTARAAYERSYNITFASDAMADMNIKAHENSLTVIFPRIGEIDTTEAIIAALGK